MPRLFVHTTIDTLADYASELAAAARRIDPAQPPVAIVTGYGPSLDIACDSLRGAFAETWKVGHEALVYPNAELVRQVLAMVLPQSAIVLLPHSHFGVDLGPGLSIRMGGAFLPDVVEIDGLEGMELRVVRQEFGGQVSAHVVCDISTGAVINIRPGAFRPADGPPAAGTVVDRSPAGDSLTARRRYIETIRAEAGDVDITRHKTLVSVGRGIEDRENVAIAEELAEALGAAVSCSRPVVDARWLDKSRQVGSSGKTVKPKVYLACGISGSFQHLAGLKGNPFIVAINKNPKAPIFRVANVGIVDNILEFLPEMTRQVRERVSATAGEGRHS
jgi:electron transfer flavoprotein alpha subunit